MHLAPPWNLVVLCVLAYAIGSLPLGFWLTRWRRWGLDLRRYGSGNVGTSNVFRHAGFGLAAIVGPLQFLQGVVPVVIATLAGVDEPGRAIVGLVAVFGNGWSIWMGFEGGRGIAVSTGAVAGLSIPGLVLLLVCYAAGAVRGMIAEGVLLGYVLLPLLMVVLRQYALAVAFVVLLGLLVWRRLEGTVADVRRFGGAAHIVRDRVLHDRRPGRPLVGHRTDVEGPPQPDNGPSHSSV